METIRIGDIAVTRVTDTQGKLWNIDGSGRPCFPNATYMTHEAGWRWATEGAGHDEERSRFLAPLRASEVLELVTGDAALTPGVEVFETPGHLPGHMSVSIRSGDDEALVLGDVAVHPAQLDHPEWAYIDDEDAALATRTRRALLERIPPSMPLLCGHYPEGLPYSR